MKDEEAAPRQVQNWLALTAGQQQLLEVERVNRFELVAVVNLNPVFQL